MEKEEEDLQAAKLLFVEVLSNTLSLKFYGGVIHECYCISCSLVHR